MGTKSKVFLGLAVAYGATLAGMYFKQRDILYRAPKKTQTDIIPIEILNEDGANPRLLGWVENPEQREALIYYGGSSEPIELRLEKLREHFPNHAIYLVPYRGFGPNHKLRHDEINIKKDAIRLYDFVKTRHAEVDVIGRSLGTGMAVHVASKFDVEELGLITPYDSILEVASQRYMHLLPIERILWDKFETWKEAHLVKSKITVITAETDIVTPEKRWERLKQYLTSAKEIHQVKVMGSNHTDIVDWSETWEVLKGQFSRRNKIQNITEATPVISIAKKWKP